jgi:hypothetical protein
MLKEKKEKKKMSDKLKVLSSKKSIMLVLLLVAIVTLSMLYVPVRAWKPDQHVGMGNIVLDDLLTDGKVTINGVDYDVSPLVYEAISSYPVYYKFGCIGPDAYPDMIFGQVAIHPGKDTEESTDADVYSYEWFDHMLSQVYSANDWETCLKAIAFTYGFMSHATGDMFCHTFVNRYTGGVWSLPTNGLRHMVVESYVDKLTGWKNIPNQLITSDEFNSFSGDQVFRDWIYSTLIDNGWAREHTSGAWENFYELFFGLRDRIKHWLKEWDKDWWDRKWWACPPHGWLVKEYFKAWRDDINEGLKAWVDVSTQVAYDLFILGDTDSAEAALKGWFTNHFLSMIGFPDIVGTIVDFIGDVADWISDLLSNTPILKDIWKTFKGLWDQFKDAMVDEVFKWAFGYPLGQLKDMFKNPETWLTDQTLFGDAPYGMGTKSAIYNELSSAVDMQSGSFDPLAFDATYNTIMMSKLLLLDGAGLNKLLKDNGIYPFYADEVAESPEQLADTGMCVMRGFMKSLDADHQWMPTAPNGKSYRADSMPLWDDQNARECVFKKIFHMGSQVWVTPMQQAIHTGEATSIDVTIVNTGNMHDTFDIQTVIEGSGTFTNTNDPSGPVLPSSVGLDSGQSVSYNIAYVYNGDEEVTGGRLTVTVTPEQAPIRTGETEEILSNQEYAAIIVFKGQIKYLWLTTGEPKYVTYTSNPKPPSLAPGLPFYLVPASTRMAPLWPRSPFAEKTYVTKNTPFWVYGFSDAPIANFSFQVIFASTGTCLTDWLDLTPEQAVYVWRTQNPFQLNEQCLQHWVVDDTYEVWYRSTDEVGTVRTAMDDFIIDATPPTTTLSASDFRNLPGSHPPVVEFYPYTTFTLSATDVWSRNETILVGSGVKATYYGITEATQRYRLINFLGRPTIVPYYVSIIPSSHYTQPFKLTLPSGVYRLWYYSVDNLGNREQTKSSYFIIDATPPSTDLQIGEPRYDATAAKAQAYITSKTPLSLNATDGPIGTIPTETGELPIAAGVLQSSYMIRNETYNSGWQTYTTPFKLEGLSDGYYEIDYNSTDKNGNVEPTETAEVILDNSPPTTSLTVGEPKYISSTIYVKSDTPFTLEATDTGSGVNYTAYRIHNAMYNDGWQKYTGPFKLTSLADGTYTIEYNSTDNVKNTEITHEINVTLFSWNYIYEDTYGRGTTLKINLAHQLFQFITPDKDYGIRKATYMRQCGRALIIQHCDGELRLITVAVDTKLDFCIAIAWDQQTHKQYFLIDKVGVE